MNKYLSILFISILVLLTSCSSTVDSNSVIPNEALDIQNISYEDLESVEDLLSDEALDIQNISNEDQESVEDLQFDEALDIQNISNEDQGSVEINEIEIPSKKKVCKNRRWNVDYGIDQGKNHITYPDTTIYWGTWEDWLNDDLTEAQQEANEDHRLDRTDSMSLAIYLSEQSDDIVNGEFTFEFTQTNFTTDWPETIFIRNHENKLGSFQLMISLWNETDTDGLLQVGDPFVHQIFFVDPKSEMIVDINYITNETEHLFVKDGATHFTRYFKSKNMTECYTE